MSVVNGVVVALPPPEGYVVDFDNPQRRYVVAVYVVSGLGMLFSFVFMLQRLFVKIYVHHSLRLDDYCVILAWAFSVAMQGLVLNGFVKGFYGIHAWEMPITEFARCVEFATYIQAIVYTFPTVFSKLALLIFYLKLQNRELWYKISVWTTIFVTVGSNMGIAFSVAFACDPIRKGWDIFVEGGTCIDRTAVFKATAAFGIITDVMIIAIPIPMVVRLKLSRAKKAGLMFLFTVGSATVVTSIIRLWLLIDNLSNPDLSWIGGPVFLWICIEANLLVMCACLPTLKQFVKVIAPSMMGSSDEQGPIGSNMGGASSRSRSGVMGSSSNSRPNPKRHHYHGFSADHEYRMETLVEGGQPIDKASSNWSNKDEDAERDRDDNSAKAIIQTKTLQISYEERQN